MTTEGKIKLSFFSGKIYGTMSLPFIVKLRVYFVCPLFTTTIFPIHRLNCSLRNEIDRICCFLKTTQRLIIMHLKIGVSVDTTLTGRRPGITYCSKRILQISLHVEPDKAVFAIFAWWFHVILRKTSCISPNKMTFGNFGFNVSLNVLVTLPIMTSESHQFWQFEGPRSRDTSTGYTNIWVGDEICNVELSH